MDPFLGPGEVPGSDPGPAKDALDTVGPSVAVVTHVHVHHTRRICFVTKCACRSDEEKDPSAGPTRPGKDSVEDPAIHRNTTPAESCIRLRVRSCCMRWQAHVHVQKNPIAAAVCNAGRRVDRPGLSVSNATAVLLSPCRRMAK